MENNNFKIRIIDFYKNIDKPIIDKMVTDNSFKNILELSTVSEIPLLKKEKNNCIALTNKLRAEVYGICKSDRSRERQLFSLCKSPLNIYLC